MKSFSKLNTFIILLLMSSFSSADKLAFSNLFDNNMVIQHNSKVRVWGTAPAEQTIILNNTWSDKKHTITSNEEGNWSLELLTPKTQAKPHQLSIQCKGESVKLNNIILGDVWVCSGQSNMQWKLRGFGPKQFEDDVKKANHPQIRLCQVNRQPAITEQTKVPNKWNICTPKTAYDFSAVAYFFGSKVHAETHVPIGLISTNWGGTPAQAWIRKETLVKQFPEIPLLKHDPNTVSKNGGIISHKKKNSATVLYNGMIHPLIPMKIKGFIWYQGESNTKNPMQYRTLFPTLIKDWRTLWQDQDLPFYFVQIAPYKYPKLPFSSAYLREAQTYALKLKNTGMAITMDIGQKDDIHPKKKKPVGERLARLALAQTYGIETQDHTGPLYLKHECINDTIVIDFTNSESGLESANGKTLTHFTIAGEDKKFHPAMAKIQENSIIVSSKNVASPVAVRYAWESADQPNLQNKEQLPASSFRTDHWDEVLKK